MLKDDATYEKYKKKLSAANKSNKEAQKDFEKRLAKNIKNDSKSFFAYIRSKQRTKDKVGPLRNPDGALVIDDQDGADLLNKYFSSVFSQEDLTNVPEPKRMFQGRSEQKLTELRVSTKEVLIKLGKLKVDKSPGVTIFIQNCYLN